MVIRPQFNLVRLIGVFCSQVDDAVSLAQTILGRRGGHRVEVALSSLCRSRVNLGSGVTAFFAKWAPYTFLPSSASHLHTRLDSSLGGVLCVDVSRTREGKGREPISQKKGVRVERAKLTTLSRSLKQFLAAGGDTELRSRSLHCAAPELTSGAG